MLAEVHEMQTVLELKYLLDHVGKEVVSDFVRIFMAPDVLAEQASENGLTRQTISSFFTPMSRNI